MLYWRILRAANKNVRHAASFLRIPVSNRNDHKITDCKRQAACQISADSQQSIGF